MSWEDFWPLLTAITIIMMIVPAVGLYMTFVERKVAALVQDRIGPNRVGPLGLLQAIADAIKIMLKEQVIPGAGAEVPLHDRPGHRIGRFAVSDRCRSLRPRPLTPAGGCLSIHGRPGNRYRPALSSRDFESVRLRHHPWWLGIQQ